MASGIRLALILVSPVPPEMHAPVVPHLRLHALPLDSILLAMRLLVLTVQPATTVLTHPLSSSVQMAPTV